MQDFQTVLRSVVSSDRKGFPNGSADTSNGKEARKSYWRGNKDLSANPNKSTSLTGGNETRPKNVALLFCEMDSEL